MVQVTFTDDARRPKVITFGGTPLVKWYAYLRDDQGGRLYLRREVDGVIDPEVLVMEANPPVLPAVDSAGVTWFAFHVDPNDATQAHIYFIADGTLYRSTVTSTPIGEEPTTQQFNRGTNRYENVDPLTAPSNPFEGFKTKSSIPTPQMALIETSNPAERLLIITVPTPSTSLTVASPYFDADTIEVYVLPNGGDGSLYTTSTLPPSRQLVLTVPTNVVTFTKWAARVTKETPSYKSVFASVIDDGSPDTDGALGLIAPSNPLEGFVTKVDRQPVKKIFQEAPTSLEVTPSNPFDGAVTKNYIEPIKYNLSEAATPLAVTPSNPFEAFFKKDLSGALD